MNTINILIENISNFYENVCLFVYMYACIYEIIIYVAILATLSVFFVSFFLFVFLPVMYNVCM